MKELTIKLDEQSLTRLRELQDCLDLDESQAITIALMEALQDPPFLAMECGKHQWENGEYKYSEDWYNYQDCFDEDCNCLHCRTNREKRKKR